MCDLTRNVPDLATKVSDKSIINEVFDDKTQKQDQYMYVWHCFIDEDLLISLSSRCISICYWHDDSEGF